MHDTIYQGRLQSTVFADGTPKGMAQVLRERGVNITKMKADDMREELGKHHDFKDEKTKLEWFLHNRLHACIYNPKFHCELNPMRRVWGQAKRYTRTYCNYSLQGLRRWSGFCDTREHLKLFQER